MSKETAVDVYHRHIRHLIAMGLKLSEPHKTFLNSAYRDCKAMEREQIHAAFDSGVGHVLNPKGNPLRYYEQTYKGGEQ
jgi:hypothetical protein